MPGDRTLQKTAGDDLLGHFQDKLKRYGSLYYFLLSLFGPVYTSTKFKKAEEKCLKKYTEDHIIVNLGSGPQYFRNRRDIINVDLFGNRKLHDILFLILLGSLFPLKYLDFFLDRISYGSNIASGFGIKAQCH